MGEGVKDMVALVSQAPREGPDRVDVEHAKRCRKGRNESLDSLMNSKSFTLILTR